MIDKSYIFTEFIKGTKIICVDLLSGISLTSDHISFTYSSNQGNMTNTFVETLFLCCCCKSSRHVQVRQLFVIQDSATNKRYHMTAYWSVHLDKKKKKVVKSTVRFWPVEDGIMEQMLLQNKSNPDVRAHTSCHLQSQRVTQLVW